MANVDNVIRIYDNNMVRVAYLQNAYNIGYEKSLNSLWYASFTMPADDPKNLFIQPFYYAEIFDNGERVELFRIMPSKLGRNTKGEITYECEHVLATLLDDVLFQYHQIGNVGVPTMQCLRYVLDRQTVKRWQLSVNEFTRHFEYKWENENLLSALFSIPQPFNTAYKWEYNTSVYPWRISLKALTSDFKADITYKKNMLSIEKEVDPTTVVTRLYLLGYGEGDNQLDIRGINGGIPYLEANISKYGIKTSILVDRRFESPETLKAYGQSILDGVKEPYRSYKVKALDLAKTDNLKYEAFQVGDIVRITDREDGITEDLRIVSIKKDDVSGNAGDIEIEIANKSRDIAGSITQLADRTRINEVYAQGATNLMSIPFNDNADSSNPAIMRFYIPEEMARINKLILNYQLEPFRAYSKAVQGGGSTSTTTASGGASSTTTADGGGTSTTTADGGSVSTTTADGGGGATTTEDGGGTSTTTADGGGGATTTEDGGGTSTTTADGGGGATTTEDGGGTTTTTADGGGGATTTEDGGGTTTTTADGGGVSTTTADGGGSSSTTSNGGKTSTTTSSGGGTSTTTSSGGGAFETSGVDEYVSGRGGHNHGIAAGTQLLKSGGGSVTWVQSGEHEHSIEIEPHIHSLSISPHEHGFSVPSHMHEFNIPSHMHQFAVPSHMHQLNLAPHVHQLTIQPHVHQMTIQPHGHQLTIQPHMHQMTIQPHVHQLTIQPHVHQMTIQPHVHQLTIQPHVHQMTIPEHKHALTIAEHKHNFSIPAHEHAFALPNHIHQLEFGIYQGSTASLATLRVDGQNVNVTSKEVNIIPYLSKDNTGRVRRGTWHTVEIIPNALTRVSANIFIQLFTNSRGGGDF